MRSYWICMLIVASVGVYSNAHGAKDDYEDYDLKAAGIKDLEKKIDEFYKKVDDENDIKVDAEIQKYREADKDSIDSVDELKDIIDRIDDYQYEDNRGKLDDEDDSVEADDEQFEEPLEAAEKNVDSAENRVEPDAVDRMKDYALLWGDDSVAPLPVPEAEDDDENEAILEETKKILEEDDTDIFDEDLKDISDEQISAESDESFNNDEENIFDESDIADDKKEISSSQLKETESILKDEQPDIKQIVQETKQILAESNDSLNDNDETNIADETVNENNENKKNSDIVNKDSQEDTVESAYADLNADLEKLMATLNKLKEDDSDNEVNDDEIDEALDDAENNFNSDTNDSNDNVEGSKELIENNNEDDIDLDKLLQDILGEDDSKSEDTASEELEPMINDALNEPNPDDDNEKDVETLKETVPYLNDALIDNESKLEPVENKEENVEANASVQDESKVETKLVDDLSSTELEDLVKQFSILHSEDLNVNSETFDQDIAPVHINLKLDEPTIITSPDYPNAYPTNNIVDWVMEGDGVGIELNITDFAVNGALGDYLLIKPAPISDALEPIPEPEAVLAPPHSTTTVTLAVSVRNMTQMKEEFRLLLADMAEEYITDNYIEPGVNSTIDVTQITSIGLCPISWPDFEDCSAVSFGISLEYEDGEEDLRLNEKDLQEMWRTYSKRDPFAFMLAAMGVIEYYPPDSSAMTAWLVIGAGVVISMAMLAFVLWRYSCFEDYTRMRNYSDTDSIHNEKRNLDLYPTPHQNLPPLYAENEYKWQEEDSARVDMGGFANRSYARDNMYDFESDDDVVTTRDRNGAVTSRDGYSSNV